MTDFTEKINSFEKIYVYGAGVCAYYVTKEIPQYKIAGFIVTSKKDGDPSEFFGKKIFELSELDIPDDSLVIIAVTERHHISIINSLKTKNIKNFFCVDFPLFNSIAKNILKNDMIYKREICHFNGYDTIRGIKVAPLEEQLNASAVALLTSIDDLFMIDVISDNVFKIITEGPYEIKQLSLENGDVVFDIGAHIGLYSCIAASKGCSVYAFEPTKDLIPALMYQSKLYNGAITPVNCALSDNCGFAEFEVPEGLHNSSGKLIKTALTDKTSHLEKVRVTTIDEFVKENNIKKVDFIKSDIEGAERDMLRGAVNTLKKFAPKLSICTYHLPDDKQVLEKIVKDANPNYNIIHRYKKMYCWVNYQEDK